MKNKSLLKPDLYVKSLQKIDFSNLKFQGYKLILLDIDNTLAVHGSKIADDYAISQVERIKNTGLDCMIISNAVMKRASLFADSLKISFLPKAHKPSRRGIRLALKLNPDLKLSELVIVGDQLLTDILAGNRAGIYTILVDPISLKEARQVKIKRPLEKLLKWIFKIKIE